MADGRPNFPKLEEDILAFWEKNQIFEKSLKKEAPKGDFVFFEGPPTANGRPGIHHVEARAFKDCLPRFRTMQGYRVERKAGWDTQGLPVELEVEKEMGFTGKKDIEEFGIAEFNRRCEENVWKYLKDWNFITKRIGFWLDLEKPYVTYKPEYIESLWWIIKQVWDKGLLYQDYKVVPFCPRCGTSLSSHELAQGYKEVEDPAMYVKFRVTKGTDGKTPAEPEFLVAWTTTPWTLPANVALAVHPEISYVKVRHLTTQRLNDSTTEYLWLAKTRVEEATTGDYEIIEERQGAHLVGMEYEPLFPFVREALRDSPPAGGGARGGGSNCAWTVVPADFVSVDEGSGIVHTAVMYGADDFDLGQKVGLPKYHLVKEDGKFNEAAGPFAGRFVKDADSDIKTDLAKRGLLLREETVKHTYPFCWRCKSPLIYYAKDSWYIKMSALRNELLAANEAINWEPAHIKDGRFGEWLREVKDWAFSRERYWGTPLPIWICEECGEKTCIGSFEELRSRSLSPLPESVPPPAGGGVGGGGSNSFDPHRPYVDEVELKCGACGGTARRVSDVCDVWFDSGAMPFAQWHYPFENKERVDSGRAFPADYISEAIDQTRGWFYTLLAVSVLLGRGAPYKNCICLGHILDASGKKMSKSLGNIIEPFSAIEKYGADPIRWYMYTVNQPGDSKRFDFKALDEMVKQTFLILWNVKTFYEMYAEDTSTVDVAASPHVLDRWMLSRQQKLVAECTGWLEQYKVMEPARAIGELVNDLSTWWLRRSRDRFKGADDADRRFAIATLRQSLLTTATLMAPFTPFFAEMIYQALEGGKESVHLENWPTSDASKIDAELLSAMGRVRSIVSRALEVRAAAGRPIRQALASATVTIPEGALSPGLVELVKDELNVKDVFIEKGEYAVDLDLVLTPELIRDGMAREIVRRVNALRKKSGLTIEDRITVYIDSSSSEVQLALTEHKDEILQGTLADDLVPAAAPEGGETFRTNEQDVTIGFEKL